MVDPVEHVGGLELPPLHLLEIQPPYYSHLDDGEAVASSDPDQNPILCWIWRR
jgi:hypothetical protein